MAPQRELVWSELERVGEDDQQELLARLLERFGPEEDCDAEFNAELLRRAEELRADPSAGIPWEQFRDMR